MQNINLYQREQRRGGGPRPRQMLLGLALVALLVLLHGLWQGWQLRSATQALGMAEQQAREAEAQLAAQQANYQEPVLDTRLPAQLADKEAENRQLQRLADYLEQLDTQRRSGFAPLLAALAERHPPSGLWLTRIRLKAGGDDLLLQGLSQNQELLPLYLQSLGQSTAFSGRDFARFDLQREENDLLRFRLSSQAEDEGGDE